MRIPGVLLLLFLPLHTLLGQVIVDGRVAGQEGEALPNINILIYARDSKVLIAYAVSDAQGRWRTGVNSASDSLDVEASSIQYSNQRRRIANRTQTVMFNLVYDVKELKTFTLKAPDIEKRGDTISYLVNSFALEHNRSIADVLKNMPGIEVEPSGQILYQGTPINRFYVEGLDLMGGRYGMISNNMPHRSVSAVEIIENHQPVKILQNRLDSHQAALNLKLKREITNTGTSKLGMGHGPLLWDSNITVMTFNRRMQVANSYQANNTGKDVSSQLSSFTMNDVRSRLERPQENPKMLGIQSLASPEINESRYLDNNIHLGNSNVLIRLNRDLQLRTNLFYVNDSRREQGISYRTYYSPTDTMVFTESVNNRLHDSYLQGEFTLNRNIKENYLDNTLKFNTRWDNRHGLVTLNDENLGQSLKIPFRNISNNLQSVKPMGRHLVEFSSFVSYDYSPQQLRVSPGGFDQVFNADASSMKQHLDLRRFFADHSAGFTLGRNGLSISPRLGISYRSQQMNTALLLKQPGEQWEEAPAAFANNLQGSHTRAYLNTEISYRIRNLSLSAATPLSWQYVSLHDRQLEQHQQLSRLLFDPRITADYLINAYWRLRGSWNYSNSLGDIDEMHYGFILKNHRNLHLNAAPLSETTNHNLSAFLSYRNPINSFFNSLHYIYRISDYNLIYSNQVQPDASTILQTFQQPNTGYSHHVNGQTSKYFSSAKTSLGLRAGYMHNRRYSLLNQQLFSTLNEFINITPRINTRFTEWLRGEYRFNISNIRTSVDTRLNSSITMNRHYLIFHTYPRSGHYVSLTNEYYRYRDHENVFVDLMYRYSIKKHRVDIEARWLNIFNTEKYTSIHASTFSVIESTYILRPSQLFLSVRFSI